jgi:8-oxo-dGTP pyrophosphatase MutT (NUDIX family)
LFVTVLLPTCNGGVLVARAAQGTAKAGLWQLPGGSVLPPDDTSKLDIAHLAIEASRELFEETGIRRQADGLQLWAVSQGEHGNVGVCFRAHPADANESERARDYIKSDEDSELQELAVVGSLSDLDGIASSAVDYVIPCVSLFVGSPHRLA